MVREYWWVARQITKTNCRHHHHRNVFSSTPSDVWGNWLLCNVAVLTCQLPLLFAGSVFDWPFRLFEVFPFWKREEKKVNHCILYVHRCVHWRFNFFFFVWIISFCLYFPRITLAAPSFHFYHLPFVSNNLCLVRFCFVLLYFFVLGGAILIYLFIYIYIYISSFFFLRVGFKFYVYTYTDVDPSLSLSLPRLRNTGIQVYTTNHLYMLSSVDLDVACWEARRECSPGGRKCSDELLLEFKSRYSLHLFFWPFCSDAFCCLVHLHGWKKATTSPYINFIAPPLPPPSPGGTYFLFFRVGSTKRLERGQGAWMQLPSCHPLLPT